MSQKWNNNFRDWKKQYSSAVLKSRDWRDLYALISGRKGHPSQKYLTEELNNNKDRIIEGLQYFHSQEMKLSAARESNISKECGSRSSWSTGKKTDITATFLMNKLQLMTVSYFLILFTMYWHISLNVNKAK